MQWISDFQFYTQCNDDVCDNLTNRCAPYFCCCCCCCWMVTMMMMSPWRTRAAAAAAGPLGISCLQTSYHSFTVSSFHFSHTSLQKVFLHNGPFRQCLQFSQKGLWNLRKAGKNFIDKIFDSVKNLEIMFWSCTWYLSQISQMLNLRCFVAKLVFFCKYIIQIIKR